MNWQPIETAPKDRDVLLWFPAMCSTPKASVGNWDDDRYAKKPRPFWTCECEGWAGKNLLRANPPTHWCEITPPEDAT